jgi:hypothetical protein
MSPSGAASMEKRIQVAGVLLIIGLVIEAVCLLWGRPISFVIFVAIGGLFLFAGVVVFLISLVSTTRASE